MEAALAAGHSSCSLDPEQQPGPAVTATTAIPEMITLLPNDVITA